uniref:Uncharacterized protein n=1 Tax=Candidatus Kentrum sp. DK TaxID=2126562 RepID=A0A450TIZ8_9GAMM|nr:MAG: hypothetical protein BECKDK2373C_GA0170839_11628 [Candidatus Kentron sp. DK]
MLTQIDVERLPAYRRVMEKGMERGMERGGWREGYNWDKVKARWPC